jgi:vesicle-fusing ATPase
LGAGFGCAKLINAEGLVGLSELVKGARIAKVFDDAGRSALSVVVLERLLEYTPVGPRFSNGILQDLMVVARKLPPPGRRILVIGTTSAPGVLRDLDFYDSWDAIAHVPPVRCPAELAVALQGIEGAGEDAKRSPERSEDKETARFCAAFGEAGAIPIKRLIHGYEAARQEVNFHEALIEFLCLYAKANVAEPASL